jgi:voltage-gated potassium channel
VVVVSLLRAAASVTLLLVVYYVVPLDRPLSPSTVIWLGLGFAAAAAIVAWQVRAVLVSDVPRLRATQTVVTGLAVFLVLFASIHFRLSQGNPDSFTEPLSRTDSLYFTITLFATVGFGDIAPRTEVARILTMIQMVVGLVLVGLVARILLGAVQTAEQRREATSRGTTTTEPGGDPLAEPDPGRTTPDR